MSYSANRYNRNSNRNIKSNLDAHLYWEGYELTLDMRYTPIECIFFIEDCILLDAIWKEREPVKRIYNLFIDILWEVFREKTTLNKQNLQGLINSIQGWYWSECETKEDIEDRWYSQKELGQLLLNYPTIFDSDWVERNFFRK